VGSAIFNVIGVYSGLVEIYHKEFDLEWPFPPGVSYTKSSNLFKFFQAFSQSPNDDDNIYFKIKLSKTHAKMK
jgi:hypothetical protein